MWLERVFHITRQALNDWEKSLDTRDLSMGFIFATLRKQPLGNADELAKFGCDPLWRAADVFKAHDANAAAAERLCVGANGLIEVAGLQQHNTARRRAVVGERAPIP